MSNPSSQIIKTVAESIVAGAFSLAYVKSMNRKFTILQLPSFSPASSAALTGALTGFCLATTKYLFNSTFKTQLGSYDSFGAPVIVSAALLALSKKFSHATKDFAIILLISSLSHIVFAFMKQNERVKKERVKDVEIYKPTENDGFRIIEASNFLKIEIDIPKEKNFNLESTSDKSGSTHFIETKNGMMKIEFNDHKILATLPNKNEKLLLYKTNSKLFNPTVNCSNNIATLIFKIS